MLATAPSACNCRANSLQSHCDRLRPRRSGISHAILTKYRATPGENFGVRPGRGFSSSPCTPCWRNRWPHLWTCRGDRPTLSAVPAPVSYTHLRAHETDSYLVCRLLLEKKKTK